MQYPVPDPEETFALSALIAASQIKIAEWVSLPLENSGLSRRISGLDNLKIVLQESLHFHPILFVVDLYKNSSKFGKACAMRLV